MIKIPEKEGRLSAARNPGCRDIFFLHTVADKSINCSA